MYGMPEFEVDLLPTFAEAEAEVLKTRTAREILDSVAQRLRDLPGEDFLKGIDLPEKPSPPPVRELHPGGWVPERREPRLEDTTPIYFTEYIALPDNDPFH